MSGMLLYCSQSFLQVLDGDPVALSSIYAQIAADSRHTRIRLLLEGEVSVPLFPDWDDGLRARRRRVIGRAVRWFHPGYRLPAGQSRSDQQRRHSGDAAELVREESGPVSTGTGAIRNGSGVVDDSAFQNSEVELFSVGGLDGILREVNQAFAALLGRRVDELSGRSVLEFVHPEDLATTVAGIGALEGGEREVLVENRFLQADGSSVHLQWVARPVAGSPTWWAAGRDTTKFHRLLARHEDLRVGMDLALGQNLAAMWDLDVKTGAFTWEAQAAELLDVTGDELPVTVAGLAGTVHPDDSAAVQEAVQKLGSSGAAEVIVRVGLDTGRRFLSLRGKVSTRDRRGRPVRAVGLLLDVTAEKAMEEQLLRLVMSDALTGVANRRAFDQALRTEWRRCARAGEPLSVLMVDIDNFKRFNDTFGHPVGDAALIAVARTLADGLHRAGDVLARYGGEEFAVILPGRRRRRRVGRRQPPGPGGADGDDPAGRRLAGLRFSRRCDLPARSRPGQLQRAGSPR